MVRKKRWSGLVPCFDKPVMFVSDLQELREIKEDKMFVSLGAACSLTSLIESSVVPDYCKQAFLQMASPGIRNMATLGGNICNCSPAGDSLPVLYAMDAVLTIESSCRKRELPIEDFITGPGKNILKPGELLTAIKLPQKEFNTHAYKKVGTRSSTSLSKLSFAALADVQKGVLKDIRIAFGAVAPTIVRNRDIEQDIISKRAKGILDIPEIIGDYRAFIKPIDDQRSTAFYRKHACLRLLEDFMFDICNIKQDAGEEV